MLQNIEKMSDISLEQFDIPSGYMLLFFLVIDEVFSDVVNLETTL